ncbi:hypothetical protein DFAR_1040014 [Desulfarculales bacterium]
MCLWVVTATGAPNGGRQVPIPENVARELADFL